MKKEDVFRQNNAKAIWKDGQVVKNRFLRFQTEFEIEKTSEVQFYICTDTKYELYINGNLTGFGQYDDFPKHKAYDCYDISNYVNKGKNLVSILAWSAGVDMPSMHLGGLPMVIFTAVQGGECVLRSCENIKCSNADAYINGEIEQISNERVFNFGFDLRYDDLWKTENVSQMWDYAKICDDSDIVYYMRPVKNLVLEEVNCGKIISQGEFVQGEGDTVAKKMQYASMAYRDKNTVLDEAENSVTLLRENVYCVIDLGEETAGYFVIDAEAEDGAILDVACGEHLADLRVRSWVGDRNYAFRCVMREGRQRMCFYIQRLAGRYLQIFAHKGLKKINKLGLHKVSYPVCEQIKLQTSDRLLNKIYDVGVKTLKLCMFEHYEDCPQREQSLYPMDSRNQMLAGYYAFGETAMPKASLSLLAEGQLECGLLEVTAPSKCERTIPSFSLIWITAVKEYVLFSGNTDFIKDMLPVAQKILRFFKFDDKKNLVLRPTEYRYWNFYEWNTGLSNWDEDKTVKYDALLNAFYMMALNDYAQLCDWVANNKEAQWARQIWKKISNDFHDTFYCVDMGAYCSYIDANELHFSQLTQALAVLCGAVPKEYLDKIRERVLSEELIGTSLSHSIFKYDALLQEKKYIEAVLNDIEKLWGHMLYNGATSFWETIKGANGFLGAASLCHGWSAVPVYILWRYVMGIFPKTPGFHAVETNPYSNKIRAEGIIKTPNGLCKVEI